MSERVGVSRFSNSTAGGSSAPLPQIILPYGAEVLDRQFGEYLFCAWHNISVVVWKRRATAEALERLGRAVASIRERHPSGRSSIHVVMDGAEPPTTEAESAFVELMMRNPLACVGVVFMGSGFMASRLRSTSTNMRLKARRSFELRHHARIDELGTWLPEEHRRLTGVKVHPDQLCSVVAASVDAVG